MDLHIGFVIVFSSFLPLKKKKCLRDLDDVFVAIDEMRLIVTLLTTHRGQNTLKKNNKETKFKDIWERTPECKWVHYFDFSYVQKFDFFLLKSRLGNLFLFLRNRGLL